VSARLTTALLIQADAKLVGSCLEDGRGGMKRAMLELVANCGARITDLIRYIHCTLLHAINADVGFPLRLLPVCVALITIKLWQGPIAVPGMRSPVCPAAPCIHKRMSFSTALAG
jgi:hypothetical protein